MFNADEYYLEARDALLEAIRGLEREHAKSPRRGKAQAQ